MSWLSDNFAGLLIGVGLTLLVFEMVIFGFSGLILFFAGLACLASGTLMWLGLVPATVLAAFASVAVLTLVFAVALWKPLKRLQNSPAAPREVQGDLIGHRFVLTEAVTSTKSGEHRFSGVNWKVRSERPIPAGVEVAVVKAEVGVLTVAAVAE